MFTQIGGHEVISCYLAGAMEIYIGKTESCDWRKYSEKWFEDNTENIKAVNPASYYDYNSIKHKTDSEIMRFDLYKVKKSDVILADLNEIRRSIGTTIEIYEAFRSGIPIIGFVDEQFENEESLKSYVHSWIHECCMRIETGSDSLNLALQYIKDYYGN